MGYQEEQNQLLKSFLDRYQKNANLVEFFISPNCNQKCEYCYLMKHNTELYPPEFNNRKIILRNFKLLLEYLYEENYQYKTYDIFTGEMFALPYWEEIFEIIYDFHKNNYYPEEKAIDVPTNGSFIMDDEKTVKIEAWINKFKEINVVLYLSLSVDGPSSLENVTRPNFNYNKNNDNFYDKIFTFAKKYGYCFHPMVTADFVNNYKENYDWWINKLLEYNLIENSPEGQRYALPMFLEVRDPYEWEDKKTLENYKQFLLYMAEKDLEIFHHNDIKDFAAHVFNGASVKYGGNYGGSQPYLIAYPEIQTKMPCSIQAGPVFRLGDLALVPCHRTSYENLVFGKLTLNEKNDKIIDIQAEKPILALKIKTLNPNRSMLKCSDCQMKAWCLKGCLGSQYENQGELFSPNENICDLFKVKYTTIHEIAEKYGLYKILYQDPLCPQDRKEFVRHARSILQSIK